MQTLFRPLLGVGLLVGSSLGLAQPPQPLAVLKGHTDPVYSVAVRSDGRIAATGSFDKTIKLWDLASRKEIRNFAGTNGHQNQVLAVAFSPSGDWLASGSSDNTLRIWDLRILRLGSVWQSAFVLPVKSVSHPNLVDAVAFDKTGTRIATGCHDGILRIVDTTKGALVKAINAHTTPIANPIYTVAWSPDGKTVATGSFDKSIRIWDVESGKELRVLRPGTDRTLPDAKLARSTPALIGALGSSYYTAPAEPGHRDQVFTVAFTKDGKKLASASSDRTIKLWDVATGDLIRSFANPTIKDPGFGLPQPSHPGFIHMVRFTADETRLVSVGSAPRGQGYVAVWKVADGSLLAGQELAYGTIYAVDQTPTGLLLGCGPKVRFQSEADAIVWPLAGK